MTRGPVGGARSAIRQFDKGMLEFPVLNSHRGKHPDEEETERRNKLWSDEQKKRGQRLMADKLIKKMDEPIKVAPSK